MQALKEWAVACRALEEGKQILILRKGGILEYRSGFEVKHNKFWLFPTFEHQSRISVKPEFLPLLDDVIRDTPDPANVVISSYAVVAEVYDLVSPEHLKSLGKFHIWTEDYITQRMNYNPTKPMSLLVLRVFKSRQPLALENRPEWAGCKSWVPLDLEDASGYPVLDDHSFDDISGKVKEALSLPA